MTRARFAATLPLVLCGATILLGLIALVQEGQRLEVVVALWSVLFALMLVAWRVGARLAADREGRGLSSGAVAIVVLFAALFRLSLIPAWPTLSDDIYRYLWDGRVTLAGIHPYDHVPSDPALVHLRGEELYPNLNSQDFYSLYPPLSQGLFALAVGASEVFFAGSLRAAAAILKGFLALFDLGSVLLLLALLRRLELRLEHALLYAWNPLPIVEFAANGHSDAPMVFGLLLVLWAVAGPRGRSSGRLACLGLALAVLSKLLPILLAPLVLARIGWKHALWLVALLVVGGWPLLNPETARNYLESVRLYYAYFEFNSGLYLGLKEIGRWLTGTDVSKQLGPALAGVFVAWFLAVTGRFCGRALREPTRPASAEAARQLLGGMLAILGGYLVLATTLHPWYVTWVLALAALSMQGTGPAWIWLSGAVGWSYLAYARDPTHLPHWIVATTWLVFAALLAQGLSRYWLAPILWARARWKAKVIAPHVVGRSLLDVGAGRGEVAARLGRMQAMRVTLLDTVDYNQSAHGLVLYDGRAFPFRDREFDTVTALTVLHHCRDPDQVLDECVRVTKKRLILTESVYRSAPGRWLLEFLDRHVNRLVTRGRIEENPLRFCRVEAWRQAFRERRMDLVHERWLGRGVHEHVLFVLERPSQAEAPAPSAESSQAESPSPAATRG